MSVLGWILTLILAGAFAAAGAGKLLTPQEKLRQNPRMAWAGDFSSGQVKAIGALELVAVVGLILPWLTNIAPVLTPLAALGIAALMIGAAVVHTRRHEPQAYPINAVLFVLAIVVAVIRFSQL